MSIFNNKEFIIKYIRDNEEFIDYNNEIFEILEGNLIKKLFEIIDQQLTNRSAKIMKSRAVPLNVLKKIIEKLSKLYFQAPQRLTYNPSNQDLINEYVEMSNVNTQFGNCNENFNAYKNCSMEIIENVQDQELNFQAIPSNSFLVWNDNPFNPLQVNGYIKFMGTYQKKVGNSFVSKNKFWIYTDEEFMALDEDMDIVSEDMLDNEGVNPFGVIPFSYLTRSDYLIIPKVDSDTLRMSTMIPLLLSETSFASMFLANPIIYGVDLDIDNLNLSPAQFWDFKSTDEGKTPSIGVIKPDLNMTQQIQYAKELLGLWLETRNIKAGAIGNISGENVASGIALAIREMDTTQDRMNQEKYFQRFETDFWQRVGIIHNELTKVGRIKNRKQFVDPENMQVRVEYAPQEAMQDEATKIQNAIMLLNSGLTSRKKAIKSIFDNIDDEEIEALLGEIDNEETIEVSNANQVAENTNQDT